MADIARKKGKIVDIEKLQKRFEGSVVVETTARVGLGKDRLTQAIQLNSSKRSMKHFN